MWSARCSAPACAQACMAHPLILGRRNSRPLVDEAMSWPGRSHLAASVAGMAEGDRVTVCGWVDRYRSARSGIRNIRVLTDALAK